jgi:hypothetical protein
MRGAIPPLLLYVFMAWYLVKHKDNFSFTFHKIREFLDEMNNYKPFNEESVPCNLSLSQLFKEHLMWYRRKLCCQLSLKSRFYYGKITRKQIVLSFFRRAIGKNESTLLYKKTVYSTLMT